MEDNNNEFWNLVDAMVNAHKIVIDRPKGSHHHKYHDYIYPFDYGFLEGTSSNDGDGIDIWIGSSSDKRVSAIISSVDCIKNDSEIKFLYACTDDEIQVIYKEHNRSDSMKGILTRRYNINKIRKADKCGSL